LVRHMEMPPIILALPSARTPGPSKKPLARSEIRAYWDSITSSALVAMPTPRRGTRNSIPNVLFATPLSASPAA
jgi:hypothetical protein